jgi:sugar phosphate isomerase/epimerase
MKTSRRDFLNRSVLAMAGVAAGRYAKAGSVDMKQVQVEMAVALKAGNSDAFKISLFSKHLQWLGHDEMARVAAEMGFDGIDLTVRPQGHVLPENVERDLPKAMEAVKKAGMNIYMITTSIQDAGDQFADQILKTAGSLGIRHYRMGWLHYEKSKSVEDNITEVQGKLSKLAALNEKYSVSGEYQNHSGIGAGGIYFGGALWDLSSVLKNINSPWLGSQYDIYHATVEGANTWPVALELISPHIRSIDIKDFKWVEKESKIRSESVPLGQGMVDFKQYFSLLKEYGLKPPISVHCEYPLGGAENGANKLTIKKEDVIAAIRKDLLILKEYLQAAGLS